MGIVLLSPITTQTAVSIACIGEVRPKTNLWLMLLNWEKNGISFLEFYLGLVASAWLLKQSVAHLSVKP